MLHRLAALCLGAILALGSAPPSLHAQPTDSLLQGPIWKAQGLTNILPAWTEHARNRAAGGFYSGLDRDWTPTDTTHQYPGMLARHLYSYSAGYLMNGQTAHLQQARTTFDFMVEHGWDERFGGWYNAVRPSGAVADSSKDLFMQIYATTGLALYYIVTRDSVAKEYLARSRRFMKEHAWDEQHGGYVDVLARNGSVKSAVKDFSPQLAPLSGYLLYLYPATRDSTYLREAERIMDLTLTHMQGDRGWIRERFARDWTFLPNDSKNSHLNVGHNLEVAWLLLRLHALTGTNQYRREGLALADTLLEHAFHDETGAWRHKLKRTDPSQPLDSDRKETPDTAVWWVQAYGNMLQLYAYRTTGKERYLDAFRSGARFWNEAFVDEMYGGTVLRATLDGTVVDGEKAVRTKTSYHAVEHALLNFLYLTLWVNEDPVTLHYHIDGPFEEQFFPLPVETDPTVQRITVEGRAQTPPGAEGLRLQVYGRGPADITVTLTDSTRTSP